MALDTLITKRFFVSYYQQYQCSLCVSWRSGKTQHHPLFKVLCWFAFDSTIKGKNLQIQVPDTNFMKYFMITFYSVLSPWFLILQNPKVHKQWKVCVLVISWLARMRNSIFCDRMTSGGLWDSHMVGLGLILLCDWSGWHNTMVLSAQHLNHILECIAGLNFLTYVCFHTPYQIFFRW